MAQGGVRAPRARRPGAAPGRSAPRTARRRNWTRSSGSRWRTMRGCSARGRMREGRRVRRGELRSARLLQARGRLRDVHPRSGAVLPRMPARHLAGLGPVHRPLRPRRLRTRNRPLGNCCLRVSVAHGIRRPHSRRRVDTRGNARQTSPHLQQQGEKPAPTRRTMQDDFDDGGMGLPDDEVAAGPTPGRN